MSTVSEYFSLGRDQPTLDFVDVPIDGDLPVFIDPRALRLLPSEWAERCVFLVQNFFQYVLGEIGAGRDDQALAALSKLREPNETHLGLSQSRARGHALGEQSARKVWEALRDSEAVQSGLLEDLEDTALLIEGIGSDIVSDITTDLIRGPLIEYTHDVARAYEILLTPDVDSGWLWNPSTKLWMSELVPLPMTPSGKLLLVPKVIVRKNMDYDPDEYCTHYVLPYLQEQELQAGSSLVELLKSGVRRVTKRAVRAKYGSGKRLNNEQTLKHPELLERYRRDKQYRARPPLDHLGLADRTGAPMPDWAVLLHAVRSVPEGASGANDYHRAVEALLSALFYPALANPHIEHPIHEGRKRIDITYTNLAGDGFFHYIGQHHPASHIFVECKNYRRDPANPEIDQLQGRFSPNRGKVGLLLCRQVSDMPRLLRRCRDTAADDRGFIIPLEDTDVETLVQQRGAPSLQFQLLYDRYQTLVM